MDLLLGAGSKEKQQEHKEVGHRRATKTLSGNMKWEISSDMGKGGSYPLGTRAGRKSAKRLAPKTLVTTDLETLAACSN